MAVSPGANSQRRRPPTYAPGADSHTLVHVGTMPKATGLAGSGAGSTPRAVARPYPGPLGL